MFFQESSSFYHNTAHSQFFMLFKLSFDMVFIIFGIKDVWLYILLRETQCKTLLFTTG